MFCIHPISPETSFDVNVFECLVPNDTAPYVRKKSVRRKKHREDDIIATWALGTPNACGLNRLLLGAGYAVEKMAIQCAI